MFINLSSPPTFWMTFLIPQLRVSNYVALKPNPASCGYPEFDDRVSNVFRHRSFPKAFPILPFSREQHTFTNDCWYFSNKTVAWSRDFEPTHQWRNPLSCYHIWSIALISGDALIKDWSESRGRISYQSTERLSHQIWPDRPFNRYQSWFFKSPRQESCFSNGGFYRRDIVECRFE